MNIWQYSLFVNKIQKFEALFSHGSSQVTITGKSTKNSSTRRKISRINFVILLQVSRIELKKLKKLKKKSIMMKKIINK